MCLPSLELCKISTLFLGFIFKALTCEVNKTIFLFVADLLNPIPIIVKLWESQMDMGLHVLMGMDLMR